MHKISYHFLCSGLYFNNILNKIKDAIMDEWFYIEYEKMIA
ncbi:hypothetical protein IFVP182_P20003 [Vibrio parahaemolyticus]